MTLTTAQLEQLTQGQDAARKRGMAAERIQMLDKMVARGVKAAETFRSHTQDQVNAIGKAMVLAGMRVARKLADMAIQLHTSRLLSYRVGWLQSSGAPPSHESSVSRLFATELTQRLVQLGMETLGLWAQPTENSSQSVLHGKVQKLYRGQRAITIGAGTSEIQRNTIAMRGLGLPRG